MYNEQRKHNESMTSKQAKLIVLTNYNNNNKIEMISMQANYYIEENDRKEEKDTDNRIQCAQIDKSIHELKGNKDSKRNVWQLKLFNYRFPSIEANKK